MPDHICVVIVSHNSATRLPRTLDALSRVDVPGRWTVVVVDNASADATAQAADAFRGRLPLRVAREARRGKNFGCNAALGLVEGDLIVFTDDDVLPARDWLARLAEAARGNPGYDVFGGAIRPLWPAPPPDWVLAWVPQTIVYAATPPDWRTGPVPGTCVWGPNMAFRRAVFDRGHRFDTSVGPDGTSTYAMGSETEFVTRVERAGHACWHVAEAVVEHVIRPDQLERRWILGRAFRYGRCEAMLARAAAPGADDGLARPVPAARLMLRQGVESLRHRLRRDPRATFSADWDVAFFLGKVYEARRGARTGTTASRSGVSNPLPAGEG